VIERILPQGAVASESISDLEERLFPEEEAMIANAVPSRQREFRTVRGCARTALTDLGLERGPMLPGYGGAPVWPTGVVGSMTHCTGYRAAAVAMANRCPTFGIDGEPHFPLPSGVLDLVALPQERDDLGELGQSHPNICWDRLLFSAKESVYKAWFPLTGRWLGFHKVRLTIEVATSTFVADLQLTRAERRVQLVAPMTGRWLISNGLVITVASTPARRAASVMRL
jgi:4'-phosphopantetheinyl transferase EntD